MHIGLDWPRVGKVIHNPGTHCFSASSAICFDNDHIPQIKTMSGFSSCNQEFSEAINIIAALYWIRPGIRDPIVI